MGYSNGSRGSRESVGESFASFAVAVVFLFVIIGVVRLIPKQRTVEHDGHRWVQTLHGGIAHHPDCPCQKKMPAARGE